MQASDGFLPDRKNFAVSLNSGTFERQNAVAMSGYMRLSEHVVLSAGASYGIEADKVGGRAGLLFAW